MLQKYDVEYIYIGTLERNGIYRGEYEMRKGYDSEGLQKFADHPESYNLAYENEEVQIFKVLSSGEEG